MKRTATLAGLTFPLALGCSGAQTAARPRDLRSDAPAAISSRPLWQESEASWAASQARLEGEPVLIRIDEAPEPLAATNAALSADEWTGLARAIQRSYPELSLTDLLALLQATSSIDRPAAALDVQIKRAFPNGTLFVEGTRVVRAGDDELHIYVSGIVQHDDLARDHSVRSSKLSDTEIELVARGSHRDAAPAWFARLMRVADVR